MSRVSVVVVSYETREDLLGCLRSIEAHAELPVETVVVDNASRDGSPQAVREAFPAVRVIENAVNVGFGAANNQGIRATAAPLVLLLNSDAELRPAALPALVAALEARPDAAVAGPRTLDADGRVQPSFGPQLTLASEWRQRRLVRGALRRDPSVLEEVTRRAAAAQEPFWVSASCLLARRAALDAVGGFDEGFFLYEEDVDLCARLRQAGWRILYTPAAEVVHHGGRSMRAAPAAARLAYDRSHLRYYAKHASAPARLGLRALLAARGVGGLLAGPDRASARALLALALRGR